VKTRAVTVHISHCASRRVSATADMMRASQSEERHAGGTL
jgi:hypothetical protein